MQNRWYKHVAIIGDSKIDCYATYSDGDIKALQVHNGFKKLELEKQKEALIETLNMNMLYVPLSDIEDMKYNISDDDIELNKAFYGDEYISTEIQP